MLEFGTVWKHLKTGQMFSIVGKCRIESDWSEGVLYARTDGVNVEPIARSKNEFLDGRFVRLDINTLNREAVERAQGDTWLVGGEGWFGMAQEGITGPWDNQKAAKAAAEGMFNAAALHNIRKD